MALRPAPQLKFSGGLNLRDGSDVAAPDQAIDAMNVMFLPAGGVGQREGTQRFTADELTNRPDSLSGHYESDGTRQLIVGNGARLDVLNTAGVSIDNVATGATGHSFVRFAAPGSEHTLIANGTDTVRRWDGTDFSTPTYTGTTPTGRFLGRTAADNRLISARTAANPDRVLFSDPGVPTTFGANNYYDVHPGDGEPITAVVDWNDFVFVFKRSKFAYYYGTSTDGAGEPVFNFRHVEGVGSVGAACAAPEGVYFLADSGVYRTTGGRPELVSGMLDPLFLGDASLFFKGGQVAPSALSGARMWWSQSRLYLAYATNALNDRLAVFSPRDGWWTLWDIPVGAMTSFRPGSRDELVFAYATGLKHVGRYFEGSGFMADDLTTANTGGTAISSRWRQGWVSYGSEDQKRIRQTKLWGSGAAQFGLSADFSALPVRWEQVTFGTGTDLWGDGSGPDTWGDGSGPDTWGPTGTTRAWLMSMSCPGTVISMLIRNSALNTTWALHRLEHGFADFARGPEVIGSGRTGA